MTWSLKLRRPNELAGRRLPDINKVVLKPLHSYFLAKLEDSEYYITVNARRTKESLHICYVTSVGNLKAPLTIIDTRQVRQVFCEQGL